MKKTIILCLSVVIGLTGCVISSSDKVLTPAEFCGGAPDVGMAKSKKWAEQGRDYFVVPKEETEYYEVWKEVFKQQYDLDEATFNSTILPWEWKSKDFTTENNNFQYRQFNIQFHVKIGDYYFRNDTRNSLNVKKDEAGRLISASEVKQLLIDRYVTKKLGINDQKYNFVKLVGYDLKINGKFPPILVPCEEAATKLNECDPNISASSIMYKPALKMMLMSAGGKMGDKCYMGAMIYLDSGKVECGSWGSCSIN